MRDFHVTCLNKAQDEDEEGNSQPVEQHDMPAATCSGALDEDVVRHLASSGGVTFDEESMTAAEGSSR
jgi:hypothetical protein